MKRSHPAYTDGQLRKAYPPVWAWYHSRYPKPQQPRRSLLLLELVRRLSRLHLLANALPAATLQTDDATEVTFDVARSIKTLLTPTKTEEFRRLDSEINELLTYLDRAPARSDEHLVQTLEARGFSTLDIVRVLPKLKQRRAGHPVTKRVEAVRAAEMFDNGFSWTQIAQKLYPTSRQDELPLKRDQIRKAVKSLDKLFAKYGIPVPPRKVRT